MTWRSYDLLHHHQMVFKISGDVSEYITLPQRVIECHPFAINQASYSSGDMILAVSAGFLQKQSLENGACHHGNTF